MVAFDLNTAFYLSVELGKAALLCGFGIAVAAIVAHSYTHRH